MANLLDESYRTRSQQSSCNGAGKTLRYVHQETWIWLTDPGNRQRTWQKLRRYRSAFYGCRARSTVCTFPVTRVNIMFARSVIFHSYSFWRTTIASGNIVECAVNSSKLHDLVVVARLSRKIASILHILLVSLRSKSEWLLRTQGEILILSLIHISEPTRPY